MKKGEGSEYLRRPLASAEESQSLSAGHEKPH